MTLRHLALALLQSTDPRDKARRTLQVDPTALSVGADDTPAEPAGLPGRPARPVLVPQAQLRQRAVGTHAGHGALLHALAHIEHNAINLALDACWRFGGMPDAYYRDWMAVAADEARHFGLLSDHLERLGWHYGDFSAHDGLWEMVERTRDDVLARMALVPRTLEARGLDASPAVRRRLASVADHRGAAIVDVILHDEIGHVAIGNRWYRHLCYRRGLDPIATYAELALRYRAPVLHGPFNIAARRAAGFTETELSYLQHGQPTSTSGATTETP